MTTVLDRIKAYKLDEIADRKARAGLTEMEARAASAPPVRDFAAALRSASREGYGLIAEVKKASPSKGLIREDFEPASIARAYEAGGAACLSVLTDAPSFRGHEEFLIEARAAVGLPVIRKDFLYDPWQVAEARAIGADAILIIMATLSDAEARELEDAAERLGMASLVEVHDEAETERALALRSPLIGVNNRDLRTFETDLGTTARLRRMIPEGRIVVGESGLASPADLARLAADGVRCFLIGESLMRQRDVEAATRALLASPS